MKFKNLKRRKKRVIKKKRCVIKKASSTKPPQIKDKSLAPFNWYMQGIKSRCKSKRKISYNVDQIYLKQLWQRQKGVCPYTGWKLELPKNSAGWQKSRTPRRASLDRINSNKGYIQGNLQFVSIMANYAKNNFSKNDFLKFCKAVALNFNKKLR